MQPERKDYSEKHSQTLGTAASSQRSTPAISTSAAASPNNSQNAELDLSTKAKPAGSMPKKSTLSTWLLSRRGAVNGLNFVIGWLRWMRSSRDTKRLLRAKRLRAKALRLLDRADRIAPEAKGNGNG